MIASPPRAFTFSICDSIYNNLENNGVIVAFSGGADSVALLHFLAGLRERLNLRLLAVHVHHGLRGEEADGCANFCEIFCDNLGVEFELVKADVASEAKRRKLGLEEAGRALRYEAFRRIKAARGMEWIALGHNRNDVAETVLMQVLRGAARIRGISQVTNGLIRPLLDIGKEQILEYCGENGLNFRQDSTNFQEDFVRNKIRHKLLPMLEEFNPAVIEALARLAEVSQAEDALLDKLAASHARPVLNIKELLDLDLALQRRVLRLTLAEIRGDLEGISFEHIESILRLTKGPTGKEIALPGGIVACRVYDTIRIGLKETPTHFDILLPREQEVFVSEAGKWFYLGVNPKNRPCKKAFTKALDCGKIEEVRVRRRLAGDRIYFDTVGTKKIKDYFIDKKLPRQEREKAIFVASGADIICILGGAESDFFKPKTTESIFLQIWGEG
ncbi:MAG: tRNA lysidine(34) synthetase TilS [Clostridiales bacterium]|jgi:tRNA(Ile)-lysidine synthase|nr:tRNA lysidine(34) synthetase TilS [Clostridiales bacterium]